MNDKQINAAIGAVLEGAADYLGKGRQVPPTLFVWDGDPETTRARVIKANDEARDEVPGIAGQLLTETTDGLVLYVSPAWRREGDSPAKTCELFWSTHGASEMPDATECVAVAYFMKRHEGMVTADVIRPTDGPAGLKKSADGTSIAQSQLMLFDLNASADEIYDTIKSAMEAAEKGGRHGSKEPD